jgi:hypothetical protein
MAFGDNVVGNGPFINGTDIYGVFLDTASDPLGVEVWKSSDNGASWAEQDSGNHPTTATSAFGHYLMASKLGTDLAIAYPGGSDQLSFSPFDLSNDTWGAEVTGGPTLDLSESTRSTLKWVHIFKRSDGSHVVIYNVATRDFVYATVYDGGWGGAITLENSAFAIHKRAVLGASDRVHVFYSKGSAADLYHVSLSSGDAASAKTLIDANHFVNQNIGLPVISSGSIWIPYPRHISYPGDLNGFWDNLYYGIATDEEAPSWTVDEVTHHDSDTFTTGEGQSSTMAMSIADDGARKYFIWHGTFNFSFNIYLNKYDTAWQKKNELPYCTLWDNGGRILDPQARYLSASLGIGVFVRTGGFPSADTDLHPNFMRLVP